MLRLKLEQDSLNQTGEPTRFAPRYRSIRAATVASFVALAILWLVTSPPATAQKTTSAPPKDDSKATRAEPAEPSTEKKKTSKNEETDGPSRGVDEEASTADAPGLTRRQSLMASLTIFVLAVFVGFEVITKVPPTLHTPLMSGSNAISGITIVGAIVVTGTAAGFSSWLGWIAIAFAAVNVVGGFLVTHRMLAMFKRK